MKKKTDDRKFLRDMLLAFYIEVANGGYFEREDKVSIREFIDFIDGWVEEYIDMEEDEV